MASGGEVRSTGAVYTPDAVASAIIEYLGTALPAGPVRTLEPSVGEGAFLAHMPAATPNGYSYTLVDIDEVVIDRLRERLGPSAATFVAGDFVQFAMQHEEEGREAFDLIVGNPPFIRKHNFSAMLKGQTAEFAECFDYPGTKLKNAWAFFLVASLRLLSDTGLVAFVLPYELMTVEYGQALLEHAANSLERVDIFISDEKAFKDIDQDAVVFIGRKVADEGGLFINRVHSLTGLHSAKQSKIRLAGKGDRALELSAFLFTGDTIASLREIRTRASVISDYADSAPGVVSAANEYFILTEADAARHGLAAHTVPILKKGSLAGPSPTFTLASFDHLAENEPCRLLVARGERDALDADLLAYIEVGEQMAIHKRYKCRNRKRWYEVPLVPVEVGFFFKRSHSFPRMIVNEAGVHLTDTAYGLRIKQPYTMRGLCFSFYTSVTILFAEVDGRFYGGGVLELSPNEFRHLPIVYHEPSDDEWYAFLGAHAAAAGEVDKILDFGDRWLEKKKAFTAAQLKMIRAAWTSVRAHRMRHGGRML
jgi:adenine-specific DNA-methyltransferase